MNVKCLNEDFKYYKKRQCNLSILKHKLAHPGKAEDAFATLNENNEVSVQFKEAGRWS